MSSVDIPHFDLPFRLGANGANVVEQDSVDDVANCVTAIVSTHVGWRDEVPGFGLPDLSMMRSPIGVAEITSLISTQERRAAIIVTERLDQADALIDKINVGVSLINKGAA